MDTLTDIEKIVLGAAFTVGGGVLVYVVGQVLSKFFIEPIYDLRKAAGEVRFNLAFYASTIHSPIGRTKERSDKAQEALMKSSCELIADLHAIPLYGVARLLSFGVLPRKKAIEDATVQLRGLSTYVHETGEIANFALGEIAKRVTQIEKLLGLKPLDQKANDAT